MLLNVPLRRPSVPNSVPSKQEVLEYAHFTYGNIEVQSPKSLREKKVKPGLESGLSPNTHPVSTKLWGCPQMTFKARSLLTILALLFADCGGWFLLT